jgi:serine phosphatase RsbU (regulator of sigma subunit)
LRAGDVLVLYTDGLTEWRADRTTFFGEEGVCKALESLPDSPAAATVPQRLFEAAMAFCGGTLADDLAILAVSIDGDPATACPRT